MSLNDDLKAAGKPALDEAKVALEALLKKLEGDAEAALPAVTKDLEAVILKAVGPKHLPFAGPIIQGLLSKEITQVDAFAEAALRTVCADAIKAIDGFKPLG